MSRMSRLGLDLYEGRVSYNFVGRRKLWYAVSAVLIKATKEDLPAEGDALVHVG